MRETVSERIEPENDFWWNHLIQIKRDDKNLTLVEKETGHSLKTIRKTSEVSTENRLRFNRHSGNTGKKSVLTSNENDLHKIKMYHKKADVFSRHRLFSTHPCKKIIPSC